MNELVTFMAVDGKKILWVEVHSWLDNTTLHATIRDSLMSNPFSIHLYGDFLRRYVPTLWLRKDFTPINAYLRVEISPGWIWGAFIASVLFGIGSFFVINKMIDGYWLRGVEDSYLYGWDRYK